MNETTLTITGNLVDDPELRFTPSGQPVAKFRIASTPRYFDKQANAWKDGESLFLTVNVWRQAAENVAESMTRGTRAIVTGRLRQRSYETKDGREADRLRARGERGRSVAEERHGEGREGHPHQRGRGSGQPAGQQGRGGPVGQRQARRVQRRAAFLGERTSARSGRAGRAGALMRTRLPACLRPGRVPPRPRVQVVSAERGSRRERESRVYLGYGPGGALDRQHPRPG